MVEYRPKETKTILNKMKYIDGWFWCRYSLNPYSGCQHACVYCDGRSERYYLHDDFESLIYYKPHSAKMLDKRLKNARSLLPDIVATGGTCDAYQPAEKKFKITKSVLEILLKYNWPVGISTKNILIKRDLDLLNQIGNNSYAAVNFSISTVDPEISSFFEPGASPPRERLELIGIIRSRYPHIHVGLNYMPIIPLVEDRKEQILAVVETAAKVGAQYILFAPNLTMRDKQKSFFLRKLKQYCFEVIQKPQFYEKFITNFVRSTGGINNYMKKKSQIVVDLCKEHGISIRAPRWYPNDYRHQNYKAAELLMNTFYIRQIRGIQKKSLLWAAQAIQNLSESLGSLASKRQLKSQSFLTPEIYRLIKPYIKKPTNLDKFM